MVINKNGILYMVKYDKIKKLEIDAKTFCEIDERVSRDKNSIYFYYEKINADVETFTKIYQENNTSIYIDKNYFYVDGFEKAIHSFKELNLVEILSYNYKCIFLKYENDYFVIKDNKINKIPFFKKIGNYFFVGDYLYYKTYDIDNCKGKYDINSFEFVGDYWLTRDKNGLYYSHELLTSIEFPNSFEMLEGGYSKDEKYIYYKYNKIEADVNTFIVHRDYAEDKDFLYKYGVKII